MAKKKRAGLDEKHLIGVYGEGFDLVTHDSMRRTTTQGVKPSAPVNLED